MEDITEKQEIVRRSLGRQAIYREGRQLFRTVIENVHVTPHNMSLTMRQVRTRGFAVGRRDVLSIGSAWQWFFGDDNQWNCPIVGWTLYFGDGLADAAGEYAATLPDDADFHGLIMEFVRQYQRDQWASRGRADPPQGA